jgi:hypothetical protein
MRILYFGAVLAGFLSSGTARAVDLRVHDYAAGDGPANLVSNGVPFAPGALQDERNIRVLDGATEVSIGVRILARWPDDQSIRVALIQFEGAPKSYDLSLNTARTAPDRPLVAASWRFPKRIATLPADYLSASLVMWEQKPHLGSAETEWIASATTNFQEINAEPDSNIPCARTDQYYDSAFSSYGLYARTGELQYLVNGRRWAYHHGRDQVLLSGGDIGHGNCSGGYVNNTRYTFVDSLVRDHWFWGDDESLRVAGLVADNFYVPHPSEWYYQPPLTRGFWTEREAAFAQLGLIAYYEATGDAQYLNLARDRFHELYRMQADNNNGAWIHNLHDHDPEEGCAEDDYGSSSFMSGLLFESLIRYHKLTCDPIALESIYFAADYLRTVNVATGDYAGASLIYLGCPQSNSDYVNGNPDLDNLVSHAYAYAYRASGFTRTTDRDFGLALFNTAVEEGFFRAPKQFNQGMRSSGHFVAYLDPNIPGLKDCNAGPAPDGGVSPTDAGGEARDGTTQNDAAAESDANDPNTDASTASDARVSNTPDAGVADGAVMVDGEDTGCGCSETSGKEAAPVLMFLMLAVLFRRTLSRSRNRRGSRFRSRARR